MFDNNNINVEDDQENEPPKPSTSTMKQQPLINNNSQQQQHFVLPNWKHSAAKASANLDKILRDIEELNVGGFKKKVDNNNNNNDGDDDDDNVWSMPLSPSCSLPLSPLSILRNIGGSSATTNNKQKKSHHAVPSLDDDSTTKKKKRQGGVTTAAVSSDGPLSKSTPSSSSTVPSSNNNNNNTPPQRLHKKKMTTAKDYREVLLKKKNHEKKEKKEKKSSNNNLSPTPSTDSSQSTTAPYTSSSTQQQEQTTKDNNKEEVINATVLETVPTTELLDASDNAVRNIIQKVQDTIHDMNIKIELKEYELYNKKGGDDKNEMNVKSNVNDNNVKGDGEDELKQVKEVEEERQKIQLLKQKQQQQEEAERLRLEEEAERLRLEREQEELVRKKQQEQEKEAERITKETKERQTMIELVNGILQINNNNKYKKKEEQEYNGIYKILGLEYNASLLHIKKAYRKLALKLHPDKDKYSTPNANEAFQIVSHAYNVLVDPESRQEYDDYQLRKQQQQQQQPRSSYGRSNSQQQQQQPIAWSKYNTLPKGTRVTILTNDSKLSHFNGLQGCTIDHTTTSNNNNNGGLLYTIQMDGTSGTIIPSIQCEYLFQNVIVCLRASKIQELGLLTCGVFLVTLISYYKDNIGGCYQGRYTIENNNGGGSGMTKMTYLRSEQFIIPNGTIVKVVVGNLPYQYGTIINWKEEERMHGSHVEDTSYYEVQLSHCNVIRVKMANIRL